MYFSTASFSVIALSFLLTATCAEPIDPSNIEPSSSIYTTTTESQRNSCSHPIRAQAPYTVIVNGQTIDTCSLLSTTEGSSITAAPRTIPTGTFQHPCVTTISGTVHTLCNEMLASEGSSAEMTTRAHEDPGQKNCVITVNGTPFWICTTASAAGASSAAGAVAQRSCFKTVNGQVFNICNILTNEPMSTTVPQPTLDHPHASCLVTDSHGNVHNTCHDQATTTIWHSSTTAAPQGGCLVNGQTISICDNLKSDSSPSSTTTPPTGAYTKEEL
jgi:hypothetical protein